MLSKLFSSQPADYIPQLARMSAKYWGVSVCTTDGQRYVFKYFGKRVKVQEFIQQYLFFLALVCDIIVILLLYLSRKSFGDTDIPFCIQSCCKPLNYALAVSEMGANRVHDFFGQEPSGRSFNELTLDHRSKSNMFVPKQHCSPYWRHTHILRSGFLDSGFFEIESSQVILI